MTTSDKSIVASFWRDRSVFVTGGSGFLGSALVSKLLDLGARVTCLVRDQVPASALYRSGAIRQVNVVHGDLGEIEFLERCLGEYEIETVFHLAAQAIVGVANRNPVPTFKANIEGTWNILEACRHLGSVSQIVIASSDKAYGDHKDLPYRENFALQGLHPYDASKSCADLLSLTYFHTYALPVCITRCGNLFGSGDLNFNRIVPGTIKSVLQNVKPVIRSDGSPLRDYIYVKDAVDAYLLLAEKMTDDSILGHAFNFGTAKPISVLDITRKILSLMDRDDLEPVVMREAGGEILHQYLSSEKAREMLGWEPVSSIDRGLLETIEGYREFFTGSTG